MKSLRQRLEKFFYLALNDENDKILFVGFSNYGSNILVSDFRKAKRFETFNDADQTLTTIKKEHDCIYTEVETASFETRYLRMVMRETVIRDFDDGEFHKEMIQNIKDRASPTQKEFLDTIGFN